MLPELSGGFFWLTFAGLLIFSALLIFTVVVWVAGYQSSHPKLTVRRYVFASGGIWIIHASPAINATVFLRWSALWPALRLALALRMYRLKPKTETGRA